MSGTVSDDSDYDSGNDKDCPPEPEVKLRKRAQVLAKAVRNCPMLDEAG